MTCPYAKSMADWSEWQRAYRFGVLLVLPPEPVRNEINAFRAIYDPVSHVSAEAHISLTVPFPVEPDDHAWLELERVASRFQPFAIRYGPLVPFLPKPGAALDVKPQAEIDHLRGALEACPIFQNASPRAYPFWAHITIAEFISVGDTEKLMRDIGGSQALNGSFLCDYLSHFTPDENFRFREFRRLTLGS